MTIEKKANFSSDDVEVLESEQCYSGFLSIKRLSLKHRLYGGGWSPVLARELMCREPGVGVLLYDPALDKVLLVEQFRVGCLNDADSPWTIELVAGIVDTDESVCEIAVRECKEEANVIVSQLLPICEYYNSPGGSTEKLSVFCAKVSVADHENLPQSQKVFGLVEEGEDIRSIVMSRVEAEQAVCSGLINNAMSIIAIQWLTLNLERVKKAFE